MDERGKRAHCDTCKLPGATRHVRKKRQTGAADAKTGKGKMRAHDGPSIPLASLGSSPFVAATLDAYWLERQLSTKQLLVDAPRGMWTAATKAVLDVTTRTPHEEVAARIGEKLVEGFSAMAPVLQAVAREMGVNEKACMGANRPGNPTKRHQHAPMGVLNLLGGGSKQWRFWPPGANAAAEPLWF